MSKINMTENTTSKSTSELFNLPGCKRITSIRMTLINLIENIFVIHSMTLIIHGLVTVNSLNVAKLTIYRVKLVILTIPVVIEVCVSAGLGEIDAGHFVYPFFC